jgi:hypothetical protein
MAEFKFNCPQCKQNIQCDSTYAGSQINCPMCQQAITVPSASTSTAKAGERMIQIKISTLLTIMVLGLSVLLAIGIVATAAHVIAGPKTATFKAFVDGTDVVKLSGKKLWIEHQACQRPGKMLVNGKKWNPVWNNNTSMPCDLSPAFKPRNPESIKLMTRAGRGTISIVEMPTPANNETLAVQLDDSEAGADWYEFAITW